MAPRAFVLASLLVALAVIIACGDGDDDGASRAISGGSTDSGLAFGLTGGEIEGQATGVTVIGVGEVTAEPDGALMRLSIGSGEGGVFDGSLPNLELLDDEELDPVVAALREAGVEEDSITVNTFVVSPYDPYGTGAAEITFHWSKPKELKTVLEAAQDAVRKETEYGIQSAATVFTIDDCEALEDDARETALKDARERAERVAGQADVKLGGITAIDESFFVLSLYGYGGGSTCEAMEELPSAFEFAPTSGNSSSSVRISVALRVTYAIE